MACEMCGKKNSLYDAVVEGATLKVCKECSKFGKVILIEPSKEIKVRSKPLPEEQIRDIIISNFPKKIKDSRESLKLTQEELALKLNLKENLIRKIESGSLQPSLVLVKKLETFLKVKLIEEYSEVNAKKINFKDRALTIGDLVKLKE